MTGGVTRARWHLAHGSVFTSVIRPTEGAGCQFLRRDFPCHRAKVFFALKMVRAGKIARFGPGPSASMGFDDFQD